MRNAERPSTLIVIVVTLALAGLIGLAVPLGSGSKPGRSLVAWTSPTPTIPVTSVPAATATEPMTALATRVATRSPSMTSTPLQPTAAVPSELTPPPTPTAQAVQAPSPTTTRRAPAVATPPAGSSGSLVQAAVAVDLLNLRGGPGQGFGVLGLARAGQAFTVTARSEDGAWLQICCLHQAPVWIATGMVTVTGAIDSLPLQPTATNPAELTPSPTPTAQTEATQPPTPTATSPAPGAATPPAVSSGAVMQAVVAVDLLNLRGGPGQGFEVIGLARAGETFTVTARSGDGVWLQICCFNQAPAWLATGMVTVTGTVESLPVAP